ncbi:uncharacterized protein V3H82_023327 [Fundulus diaphanus]
MSNGTGMVHTILLESFASDFQSTGCDFSWSNETIVLATNAGKHGTVTTNSFNVLGTSGCHAYILWTGQCYSEITGLIDYTANCNTTCSDKNMFQGDGLNLKEGKPTPWTEVVIASLVLLGLLGLILLFYKCKEKICRFDFCAPQHSHKGQFTQHLTMLKQCLIFVDRVVSPVRSLYARVPKKNAPGQPDVVVEVE